jgi:RecB family exonuclease
VRVVDLKTGSSKPTKDEVRRHGQLGTYQLAVAEGAFAEHGDGAAGAALLHLGKAANVGTTVQAQVPLADDDEPGWARALLDDTADAMSGAVFAATPGPHCGPCQLKVACPAQAEGRFL